MTVWVALRLPDYLFIEFISTDVFFFFFVGTPYLPAEYIFFQTLKTPFNFETGIKPDVASAFLITSSY